MPSLAAHVTDLGSTGDDMLFVSSRVTCIVWIYLQHVIPRPEPGMSMCASIV